MNISIKPLSTMEEAEGVAEVQRQAWKMGDIGIVPTFETRAVSDVGFVFVAKENEQVVGFIYGYHHFPDIHYSHMMAVLPEFQGRDIGFQLKKYHRKQALKSKYPVRLVQWTVDPLLPNNAYLNFAKLGGYCESYKINYYGDPASDGVEIYAGVPTDRFKLSWPIHSQRVSERMKDYHKDRVGLGDLLARSPSVNHIEDDRFVFDHSHDDVSFTVEMPSNYQEIRRNKLEIAKDWRMKFRDLCISSLKSDYLVYDYHSILSSGERRNFYEFYLKDHVNDI